VGVFLDVWRCSTDEDDFGGMDDDFGDFGDDGFGDGDEFGTEGDFGQEMGLGDSYESGEYISLCTLSRVFRCLRALLLPCDS
jgi:hypothetical protein